MTMIDNYNRLRKTAWSGIWGKRLLSELQYLLELSRAKEGKHDEVLASAIQKLDSYVSENGCITKEIWHGAGKGTLFSGSGGQKN